MKDPTFMQEQVKNIFIRDNIVIMKMRMLEYISQMGLSMRISLRSKVVKENLRKGLCLISMDQI